MKTKHVLLIVTSPFLVLSPAFPQGSIVPTTAPNVPIMKTLDQIEPRKEINATNTPGDADSVFRIAQSGSYYLSGNVSGVAGKSGVLIAADDVSLDLNGFQLKGVPGSVSGIAFDGSRENCRIRNGTIRDWDGKGIDGGFSFFAVYENLRSSDNGGMGIHVGGGSVVRGCIASENGSHGFQCLSVTGGHTLKVVIIEHCLATGNAGDGFRLTNATVNDCVAELNGGHGIASSSLAAEALTATNCLAIANAGDGISAGVGSTLTNCTAKENTGGNGIFAGEGSTLSNCTARANQVEYGILADLRSSVTNCTASANDSPAAESAGILVGAQSKVDGCTVTANTNSNGTATGQTGTGIIATNSCTVRECTVVGNRGDGIRINNDSRVVGNNCDSNGFTTAGTADGAGIHSTGSDNRIESNNVTDNDRGIQVDSTGSLIIKNSASGSTGGSVNNYVIAAGNADAAIEVPGTAFTSTNPWANFSY